MELVLGYVLHTMYHVLARFSKCEKSRQASVSFFRPVYLTWCGMSSALVSSESPRNKHLSASYCRRLSPASDRSMAFRRGHASTNGKHAQTCADQEAHGGYIRGLQYDHASGVAVRACERAVGQMQSCHGQRRHLQKRLQKNVAIRRSPCLKRELTCITNPC